MLGNGSNEVIEFLVKAFVRTGDEVITSHPSFLMYQKFVQVRGGTILLFLCKDMDHDLEGILEAVTSKTRLIFLDNPNNPCGTLFSGERLQIFLTSCRSGYRGLDEAYVDFVEPEKRIDVLSYIRNPRYSGRGCPAHFFQGFWSGRFTGRFWSDASQILPVCCTGCGSLLILIYQPRSAPWQPYRMISTITTKLD